MKRPQFIIMTDRGTLKAAWLSTVLANRPPRMEVVEELAFVHPHQHLVEQVTDMAGAYSAAESSGAGLRRMPSAPSEVHWKIEADRRAVDDLASAITRILEREKPEGWSLSAPTDIHGALVEAIPAVYRERLVQVIPKDLVAADPTSVVEHFWGAV